MKQSRQQVADDLRSAVMSIPPGRAPIPVPIVFDAQKKLAIEWRRALPAAAVVLVLVLAPNRDSNYWSLWVGAALGVVIVGYVWIAQRHAFIRVTNDRIQLRQYRVTHDLQRPARILRIGVKYRVHYSVERRVDTFLFDDDGEYLARIRGGAWTAGQIDELASALGTWVASFEKAVTPRDLHRAWRGAASWREAHPWLFAWVVCFSIVPVVAIVVAVQELT